MPDALQKRKRDSVRRTLNDAYRSREYDRAKRLPANLARRLSAEHPSAAASLCEGLDETLTVKRLGLSDTLERALSTMNTIENLIGLVLVPVRKLVRHCNEWT